jgi:N-acetylmuramoyl-L-alanine amidase
MKKTILFINAGHGGLDDNGNYTTPPTTGKKTLHTNGKKYHGGGWFYEGVFNRDIAEEFICEAQKRGYTCERTYHKSLDTPLAKRTNDANVKASGKTALWVSFHSNAVASSTAPQTFAEGVCVFVYRLGSHTAMAANQICKAVEKVFDNYGSGRRAQLVHDKSLHETTHTSMPAMLFEIGFFDNPNNADLLMNPKFRQEVIIAMLNEIEKIYE